MMASHSALLVTTDARPTDLSRLLVIARNQHGAFLCIVAGIGLRILTASIPGAPELVSAIVSFLVGVGFLVYFVRLARVLYGTTGTVMLIAFLFVVPIAAQLVAAGAVLMSVPLGIVAALGGLLVVSFFLALGTLFVVNRRASKELRAAGFSVGLLGGRPREVETRMGA